MESSSSLSLRLRKEHSVELRQITGPNPAVNSQRLADTPLHAEEAQSSHEQMGTQGVWLIGINAVSLRIPRQVNSCANATVQCKTFLHGATDRACTLKPISPPCCSAPIYVRLTVVRIPCVTPILRLERAQMAACRDTTLQQHFALLRENRQDFALDLPVARQLDDCWSVLRKDLSRCLALHLCHGAGSFSLLIICDGVIAWYSNAHKVQLG